MGEQKGEAGRILDCCKGRTTTCEERNGKRRTQEAQGGRQTFTIGIEPSQSEQ